MSDPSKTHSLSAEQKAAAHALDRHVSVTAGPGSGKTRVLVERYLHILRTQNVFVENIVAITFTNRAANEMRTRVRARLDTIVRASSASERARWIKHKRTLDGAVITTIHGFCARLLREFPIEAGVDPQFLLLDEHQARMLREIAVEEELTESIKSQNEAVIHLVQALSRSGLRSGLQRLYEEIRNNALSLEEIRGQTDKSHSTLQDYRDCLKEVRGTVRELLDAGRLTAAAREKRNQIAEMWPKVEQTLSQMPDLSRVLDYCNTVRGFAAHSMNAQGVVKEIVSELKATIWNKDLKAKLPQLWFDALAKEYALEIMKLLEGVERRLEEEKRRLAALDYDDLQIRAASLLENEAVRARIARRYRYVLVDEFQDTNQIQKQLTKQLALTAGHGANLFIVGDRRQSIYGFRGADVSVFHETTRVIEDFGGESKSLSTNYRSRKELVDFFNQLFEHCFRVDDEIPEDERHQLGYVPHEIAVANSLEDDDCPAVELLVGETRENSFQEGRELNVAQVVERIRELVDSGQFRKKDFALLFRSTRQILVYESALRRAGVQYQTVQGRGFYQTEEIRDLIQLLRFLDNRTDELALAAVLRSPLCGLSDNALLALRCAPVKPGGEERGGLKLYRGVRPLFDALNNHEKIDHLAEEESALVNSAGRLLRELLRRRNRQTISEILRYAVDESNYRAVIAANFDGAQRLSNLDKLFVLAERFERAGEHTIPDFVRFVEDFEAVGSRESEGEIDESLDAVLIMTIHQSKGQEFPVVVIPELHAVQERGGDRQWFQLDRHLGLSLEIPDMTGGRVRGPTLEKLRERARSREKFESARLLYVAATRAQGRLILAGVTKSDESFPRGSWLGEIALSLGITSLQESGVITVDDRIQLNLSVKRQDEPEADHAPVSARVELAAHAQESSADSKSFPLLQPIDPVRKGSLRRFSATQLSNFRRCPRQYYFDRVLHAPPVEDVEAWNEAETVEGPAKLAAAAKGAVIHRFCETYSDQMDVDNCLSESLEHILARMAAEQPDRLMDIDKSHALSELRPLVDSYLASDLQRRLTENRKRYREVGNGCLPNSGGIANELRFRLKLPDGILVGTIDKLLLEPSGKGDGFDADIVDFKTNRIDAAKAGSKATRETAIQDAVREIASGYELQMQAYALAVHELVPKVKAVRATLHFLDPNIEFHLPAQLLEKETCARAVHDAVSSIVSSTTPEEFPPHAAAHCRSCSFLKICPAGLNYLQAHRAGATGAQPSRLP